MSVTDEVRAATQEVAALFRDHYMVPNTWPQVRRFLAAVEALSVEGQGTRQDGSPPAPAGQDVAAPAPPEQTTPAVPPAPERPARESRAPLT